MITKDIINYVNKKLNAVIWYLIIIGLLFFILASAILFYPELLQYLFILGFYLIAFMALLIAVKINNIKENFDRLVKLTPKKSRGRK
jgi:vacuolar-type H+-ATPase subunit I/STV1